MKNDTSLDGSLKSVLEAKKQRFLDIAEEHKKKAYHEGVVTVRKSGIVESAKNVGDAAPNFTLQNATNNAVQLEEYLKKGKVILTWCRGGWCPYCNFTLQHLQKELPNFNALGANLIALTPELPDHSMNTVDKNALNFEVLSDIDNKVAKEYGLVFYLGDEVARLYNESFNLIGYNGNKDNELPLAATYIIDQSGKIEYAFVEADYRVRAEPSELTAFLRKGMNTLIF